MSPPETSLAAACRRLVAARWFQGVVLVLILVSGAASGLEVDPALPLASPGLRFLLRGVLIFFTLEITIRVAADWPHPLRFFRSPWNLFDLMVVILCLLPGIGAAALVLRLGRVLRVLRMITILPGLRLIVTAMLSSLRAVGYVSLLLLLHFYVYAVVGVALFGQNDPGHFGTLLRSLLTLFGILTLEGWVDVMYTQMLGAAAHPSSLPMPGLVSHAEPVAAPLYFMTFILLGTIVIMNLFVGVVVSAIQDARTEAERAAAAKGSAGKEAP